MEKCLFTVRLTGRLAGAELGPFFPELRRREVGQAGSAGQG